MGKIAEALKANLKEIAQSDARALREIDNELRKASAPIHPNDALNGRGQLDLLLGRGSFEKQTVSTLKKLCRENKIKGYSKLKKPELCKELKKNGIVLANMLVFLNRKYQSTTSNRMQKLI